MDDLTKRGEAKNRKSRGIELDYESAFFPPDLSKEKDPDLRLLRERVEESAWWVEFLVARTPLHYRKFEYLLRDEDNARTKRIFIFAPLSTLLFYHIMQVKDFSLARKGKHTAWSFLAFWTFVIFVLGDAFFAYRYGRSPLFWQW
ncbi:MAG: hypothetical protein FWC99_00830 [Coriobacteriia bacterium]|nr:hypothetical protein [Coriobacteriia bacterium]